MIAINSKRIILALAVSLIQHATLLTISHKFSIFSSSPPLTLHTKVETDSIELYVKDFQLNFLSRILFYFADLFFSFASVRKGVSAMNL